MYNVKLYNKISKVGLNDLDAAKYTCSEDFTDYDAVLVRSAKLHEVEFPKDLKCIARAGAGVNNIPIDRCSQEGIVVFNTPGANANAVKELVICALLLVRAVPIVVALSLGRDAKALSMHNRITVALYCTTALPIIVAVTSLAVKSGAMAQDTAGVLVAAGAITVFLMPLLASLTYRVVDAKPIEAVQEIVENPQDIRSILHEHLELERMMARQEIAARMAAKARRDAGEEAAWEDVAFALQRQSQRKRAMDEMLDFARREYAAHEDDLKELGEKADITRQAAADRTAKAAKAFAQHLKDGDWEGERRIAERAVREYRRHMHELGKRIDDCHLDDGK